MMKRVVIDMAWVDPSERMLPRGKHKGCWKPFVADKNIKGHFYCNKCGCTSPKSEKCGICGNEKKEGACTQIRE